MKTARGRAARERVELAKPERETMRLSILLSVAASVLVSSAMGADCLPKDPKNKAGKRHGVVVYCNGNGGWEETTFANGKVHGPKRVYSNEGKLESETNYANDKPNGTAKKWHPNGKVFQEMTYKDFDLTGPKKEFSEEGYLKRVENYKDGELDGERKTYFGDGKTAKLESVERFQAGKKHGKWVRYHENGKLREDQRYADDKQDGEQREYDDKGQVLILDQYKRGKRHGWRLEYYDDAEGYHLSNASHHRKNNRMLYATFHPNGTANEITCYVDGKASEDIGSCKPQIAELAKFGGVKGVHLATSESGEFYENGNPKSKCAMQDGKRHGKCVKYYSDGTISWSGEYDAGVENGTFNENFESGQTKKKSVYDAGKLTSIVEYYEEGQIRKTTDVKNNRELAGKTFYQDGRVKGETLWEGDKQIVREYHDNGKLAVKGTLVPSTRCLYGCYSSQEFEGKVERFNEEGKLFEIGEWKMGRRHGKHVTYHDNGKIFREEIFRDDRRLSALEYDAKGQLVQAVEYYEDGSLKSK